MLPSKRPFHSTMFTAGIMSRFPAWMTLQKPTSVGFRFVDAIVGNELDIFYSTLDIYKNYNSIVRAPIDAIDSLSQIELPYFLKESVIYSATNKPIYVVESPHIFLTNPPTAIARLDKQTLEPSGLLGKDIVGLEWLDGFPSGVLVVKTAQSDIEPSSFLYYSVTNKTNAVDLIPVSGMSLGIGYIGLGQNSLYESGVIESEWSLRKKYPAGAWITTSGDVATMPSGINWQFQSYYDIETGLKTYYQKLLNNPYGSGIYHFSDVALTYTPLPNTLVVKDVYNYISGIPTVIPSGGINYYMYKHPDYPYSLWSYKGFEELIPWDKLPTDLQDKLTADGSGGLPLSGILAGNVSWKILSSGGYVDDEVYPHSGTFNWIDGTGGLSNVIRISGGFSKYQIEYTYRLYDGITQISADPKEVYRAAAPSGGEMYFITNNLFTQQYRVETSASNTNSVRMDPLMVRPGTVLYYSLRMNTQRIDLWKEAQTQDKTIQFYRHNIGYTDNLGLRNG